MQHWILYSQAYGQATRLCRKLPPEPSAWHRHRCDTGYHNDNRMVFAGIMLLAPPFSLILLIPGTVLYLLSAYAAIEPGIEKRVVQPFEKSKPAENE